MATKHPARSARQAVGAASVAGFVGAAIAIATHGHTGTQPASAAQAPLTTPNTSQVQSQSPSAQQDDGGWGATAPNDDGFGDQSQGGLFSGGGGGSLSPPSHSQSGGS